jgi:hypothetical protein
MLGRYAECVQLSVLFTLNRHKKADVHTLMFNDSRVLKLELFAELGSLFYLIPISTCRCDMDSHRPQEHVGHESNIVTSCVTYCGQLRHAQPG